MLTSKCSTFILSGLVLCVACDSSEDKPLTPTSGVPDSVGGGGSGGAGGGGNHQGGMPGAGGGCTEQCEARFPGVIETLAALQDCIYCNACYDACAGDGGNACPNGGREMGCSLGAASCGQCAYSMCAWNYDGANYTGVCKGPYESCDKTFGCFDLKKCLEDCDR